MSVIHDIGYARYAGERRSPATLWRVILRQHITFAWKSFWRVKVWAGVALITTVVAGAVMYLSTAVMGGLTSAGKAVKVSDGVLIYAFGFYRYAALAVSITVGAAVIARDQERGAFTFYFSRPVRPRDYVLGKLAGQFVIMGAIFLAGPLLLALFRIGMSESNPERIDQLILLPRVLLIGGMATLIFTTLPLAFSSMVGRRNLALAIWCAYYFVGITVIGGIGGFLYTPLAAIDPGRAIEALSVRVFDFEMPGAERHLAPLWATLVSLGLQSLIASAVIMFRVQKLGEGAVGASS